MKKYKTAKYRGTYAQFFFSGSDLDFWPWVVGGG